MLFGKRARQTEAVSANRQLVWLCVVINFKWFILADQRNNLNTEDRILARVKLEWAETSLTSQIERNYRKRLRAKGRETRNP